MPGNLINQLPDQSYALKAILALAAGIVLMRLSGKKAISEMTVPEAILLIAVGTILIEPLTTDSELKAIYGGAILVIGMIILEKIQIRFPKTRKFIYGVPSTVIKDGKVITEELKKSRMTADQLQMRLRQLKVSSLSDVELAILEPSGSLSIIVKESKKPSTKEDIQMVLDKMDILLSQNNKPAAGPNITSPRTEPLFEEALKESRKDKNITLQ